MMDGKSTFPLPSGVCAIVGFGLAVIGSFILAILLGTAWGFGLFLHLLLVALVGYILAMRCTENDNELFGLVALFHAPKPGEKLADAAGRAAEAAGRLPERVAEAARAAVGGEGTTRHSPDHVPARDAGSASTTAYGGEPVSASPAANAAADAPVDAPADAPEGRRPPLLDAAPPHGGDDLTLISGVGPKLAGALNGIGVYHFSQIANWNDDELDWIDRHLVSFRGRARRDDWVGQAAALMRGAAPAEGRRSDETGPT